MKLKNTLGLVIASLCGYTSTAPAIELVGWPTQYTHVGDRDIYPIGGGVPSVTHQYFFPGDYYVESRSAHDSLTGFARRIGDWTNKSGKVFAYDLEPDFHRKTRASMRFGTLYGPHQIHATPSVRRHTHMQSPVYAVSDKVEKFLDRARLNAMTHEDDYFFYVSPSGGLKFGHTPIISAKTNQGASFHTARMLYEHGYYGDGKQPIIKEVEERMAKDFHYTAGGLRYFDTAPWWKDYSLIKDREDKMCWNPSKHKTDANKRHYYT